MFLLPLFLLIRYSLQDCSWNTCNKWSTEKDVINVHLIPHTHDDLGWIKTVDQYYYGSKANLVNVGVQYIYNTVIDELEKNPERKFSFAETGFLWRWFSSNHDSERHKLQKMVKTGQIELIGGGWVQNDEAASHYVDTVDQMTLGLKKLSQLFGECGKPQVAWQIDPFGHSKEQANLFAMMGYSSLFFARIHYLEKEARLQNKSLEFVWNSSEDLKTQILTGAFFQDNYGPPEGFCWDSLCGDDPIMDNAELDEYNVNKKVEAFAAHVKKQHAHQRSNHVMLLMGSDFQYTNANSWYTNLDKLIQYVNGNSSLGTKLFYSTPSCYVKGLLEAEPRLPTKSDDFFPYASSEHSFWTGYFTSRPTLKGMIREASSMLQLAKRLDAVADLGPADYSDIEIMERASALAQHHDAVTGTAKENVTRDYEKRLAKGIMEGEVVLNDFFKVFLAKNAGTTIPSSRLCLLMNETVCEAVRDSATFAVTVFNARGQLMNTTVRIPYYSKQVMIQNDKGDKVDAQLSKTFQSPSQLTQPLGSPYELAFVVEVPPLGYRTYLVDNSTSVRASLVTHPIRLKAENSTEISNKFFTLKFDEKGYLSTMLDLATNVSHPFRQEFFYYKGVDNTTDQPSGAYIFRPTTTDPITFGDKVKLEIVKGHIVEEVRQTISPWVTQIIRLERNSPTIQFEWTVGPIPKETTGLPITKEIVTRYITDIQSDNTFYTDSNGRQMMKRKVGHSDSFVYKNTEPVAANYYPTTNRIYIKDGARQMTVLTDRAQGATSKTGMIEVMLHRRCFYDDHWGVEEALDEPGKDGKGLVARGAHTIVIGPSANAAAQHRPLAVQLFHRPVLAFASVQNAIEYRRNYNMQFSGLTRALPDFLNLLSLEKWTKKSLLLRLEHIFQNEEDQENSKPMEFDIKNMFSQFTITSMNEVQLAANRNVTASPYRPRRISDPYSIQLKPMEIRSFEIQVQRKK